MTEIELLEKYQKEVDAIPEIRQIVSYKCEDAVKLITYFIQERYCKTEDFSVLLGYGLKHLQGKCNPAVVKDIINEWKATDD